MKPSAPKAASSVPGSTEPSSLGARKGVLFGLAAYLIWGSFPVFFKTLAGATPIEIVCHRIFWSAVFLIFVVVAKGRIASFQEIFRDGSTLLTLACSTLLIATNWLVFLYAIQREEVLQSSLGYFITPLISVLLGFLFLRERLSGWQLISVSLAFFGVLNLAVHQGQFPWIALILAISFGLYGLLRKIAKVDAMIGLTVETVLLAPASLAYLGYLSYHQQGVFLGGSLRLDLLLPLSGVVTAIPLLLFVGAARRLRLATLGFLQYLTPSLHFILAVFLYREPFSHNQLLSFVLIWLGLTVYSWDSIAKTRTRNRVSQS